MRFSSSAYAAMRWLHSTATSASIPTAGSQQRCAQRRATARRTLAHRAGSEGGASTYTQSARQQPHEQPAHSQPANSPPMLQSVCTCSSTRSSIARELASITNANARERVAHECPQRALVRARVGSAVSTNASSRTTARCRAVCGQRHLRPYLHQGSDGLSAALANEQWAGLLVQMGRGRPSAEPRRVWVVCDAVRAYLQQQQPHSAAATHCSAVSAQSELNVHSVGVRAL
jgi:hypothetical protein